MRGHTDTNIFRCWWEGRLAAFFSEVLETNMVTVIFCTSSWLGVPQWTTHGKTRHLNFRSPCNCSAKLGKKVRYTVANCVTRMSRKPTEQANVMFTASFAASRHCSSADQRTKQPHTSVPIWPRFMNAAKLPLSAHSISLAKDTPAR